ncbi:MAG: C-GCAxxG-C-C family protein [Peptostreptococcaceae bacterium]|jgi:C_GCAxxG_C_C family probable redox protein|nr:C-GCAxxG-C-C family protein [Peptostreptococcaceae bacterium]
MNKNTKLISEAKNLAQNYYSSKQYMCSEAVLAAINEVLEYDLPKEYISLMSGFPVGMGGSGCTCGALSGGIAALGLAYGRKAPGKNNFKVMKLSKQLHNEFRNKYKSTCCRVLTKDFKSGSKEHFNNCLMITGDICEITMKLILEKHSLLKSLIG